jgi:FMN phosphatase YigB (HAD superfamily)
MEVEWGDGIMMDTILFDLDGTLLPLDMERFIQLYFEEMGHYFADLIEPRQLTHKIWAATNYMVASTDSRTNENVFMEHFGSLIEGDLAIYQERFNAYYEAGFLKTRDASTTNPAIGAAVKLLKAKGYDLMVATNPIFPELAIHHRIRWAGFTPEDFSYISSYEHNHFCKPQPHFYREVLQETGKRPEQCLMVGNDAQEDLVAAETGIQTYLITDYLIDRSNGAFNANYQGTYRDFLLFARQLPPVG